MEKMTKSQLHDIIDADRARYGKLRYLWFRRILCDETARAVHLLKVLRITEYLDLKQLNSFGLMKGFWKIGYILYWLHLFYLRSKYNVYLPLHKIGPGLRIAHMGGAIRVECQKMGDHCTISAGVIIGKIKTDDRRPTIGNNVDISIGSKIIGKINIGDNCIIAPNSVVIKDIPSNSIVSGVPAKIITSDGKKVFSFYE